MLRVTNNIINLKPKKINVNRKVLRKYSNNNFPAQADVVIIGTYLFLLINRWNRLHW